MSEHIYVGKSALGKKGAFASELIKNGQVICTMRGEKISAMDLFKTSLAGRDIVVDPLQISENEYINMVKPYVLINHSYNPNAGIRGGLIAIDDISKNEEITYDYSSAWIDGFECKCGSEQCRGHIGDFSGIPKETQKRYLKLGIVPDFIRKSLKI